MERHFHNTLNKLYMDVYGKPIDTETYSRYLKTLRVDSSAASLSRIRESMVRIRDDAFAHITSCFPRKTIVLTDNQIKTKDIDLISLRQSKLLILCLCNNISNNITRLKTIHSQLSVYFEKCCLFFLNNNNKDDSKFLLTNWMNTHDNVGGIFFPDNSFIKEDKYRFLAQLRNTMWKEAKNCFGNNFDYVLVLDGVINEHFAIEKIISSFSLDEPWDIICGNRTFQKSLYHQDNISLKLMEDPNNLTDKYEFFEALNASSLHWIDKLYIFTTFYKVKSAFGGIMLMNGKALKLNSLWDEGETINKSEHISVCEKFLNVYVNPYMTYQHRTFMEGILYPKPYMFIPRDCGFFSAFNYMIGMMIQGYRIYPYFNSAKLLEKNKANNHFYYVDERISNSWIKYFKPIQFYDGDTTHTDETFLLFNNTQGELADDAFKYPHMTKQLYKSSKFQEWRENVNVYFNLYIQPSEEVQERINNMGIDFSQDFVGVLVRHPAHAVETGEIYFEDYYKVIDTLLLSNPSANIFLVTDTELAVAAFKAKYDQKIYYDKNSGRASLDNILQWAYARGKGPTDGFGMINRIGYEYHMEQARLKSISPIKMGLDIIANTYCLSMCKWFVYIPSNISLAVSYMNPKIQMIPVKDF